MKKSKWPGLLKLWCCSLVVPIASIPHAFLNTYRGNEWIPRMALDDMIPMVPWFAIPYLYWFVYLTGMFLFCAVLDKKHYYRLLASMVAGTLICLVIFYFLPSTVPRPVIMGHDSMSGLVRFIYSMDKPYDCFPSLHVLYAFLVTAFFMRATRHTGGRIFAVVSFVLISLATIFIKQHYIADALAATVMGAVFFLIFDNEYFWAAVGGLRSIAVQPVSTPEPDSLVVTDENIS